MKNERTVKLILPDKIKSSGDKDLDLIILNYLIEYVIQVNKIDIESYSSHVDTNLFDSIEISIVLKNKSTKMSTDQFLESCEIFYHVVGDWGNLKQIQGLFELYKAEEEEADEREETITNPCYGRILEGLDKEEKKLKDLDLSWNYNDPFLFKTLTFCSNFITYGLQYLPEISTEFECGINNYEYDYNTFIPYLELNFGNFVYDNEYYYAKRNAIILLEYLEATIKFEKLRIF